MAQRPEITSGRLRLWVHGPDDAHVVSQYFQRNRHHLARWSPPTPDGFYTEPYWIRRGEKNLIDARDGKAFRFAIVWKDNPAGDLLGTISLTEIVRGPLQQAYLGYGLDERAQGKGIMTEAVRVACAWAFDVQRLHRVSANYMPTNERSAEVLRRCGFTVVGYARDYLFINGAWRDHVLTALVDPRARPPSELPA
ncbi:MAG TPA: GNAT family N-acetyltransferase [Kofleriaceae bacterium]|jgi:ribosomal-protein-alanine N-acetyltransferase|nr:GNAT family N-acetyltransferase [Kofleriaceae bacterium]